MQNTTITAGTRISHRGRIYTVTDDHTLANRREVVLADGPRGGYILAVEIDDAGQIVAAVTRSEPWAPASIVA
ncbi:hypothetical protein C6V83_18165 [Gordonia iterans]|uniref:Uncharacterized protein n=1 Tax=Gordonia iterans TaxID=1004901 RepID=A0A2S0KJP7_9ACTN|nr:hypothetical protein [Gordonia iterans]AVM01904.1 hypothetical protein C6V83_18165 [Gordonia iterans]